MARETIETKNVSRARTRREHCTYLRTGSTLVSFRLFRWLRVHVHVGFDRAFGGSNRRKFGDDITIQPCTIDYKCMRVYARIEIVFSITAEITAITVRCPYSFWLHYYL